MELSYFKIVGLLIIFERLALAATGQAVNVSISMNYTPAMPAWATVTSTTHIGVKLYRAVRTLYT